MSPRPTHLDEAQAIIDAQQATIDQLKTDMVKLQAQVAWLSRQLFGRKSEKYTLPGQATLFTHVPDQAELADSSSPSPPADKQTITYEREMTASGGGGRGKRLPIPADLPRVQQVHDLPEAQKVGMKRIGEEVSEQVAFEPGKVYVVRHVRIKYARVEEVLDGSGANVVIAPKPDEGLPKCLAHPTLLAHIAVSKFADSLPLHRLEGILRRSGVELARSSMCRWMQDLARLCQPLLALMKQRVLGSHVIQADETPVKQQIGGKGPTKTCYFYSYLGDAAHPYILYNYQTSRSRAGPNGWFTDDKNEPSSAGSVEPASTRRGEPNYHGLLQCDAYTGYDELFNPAGPWRMTHIGCWAHARRKFYDVRLQFPGPCHHALAQISLLYDVEREAAALDADQRQALRYERSRPIVESLLTWCREQQHLPGTLPRSGLGEALTYTLNQADSLRRYLDDGALSIDNNRCEASLRGIAVGRKNWMFTGSEAGGKAAAAMFSLISSARRHHVEPLAYLTDLFTRLPASPISQLGAFLPDRWQLPKT